MEPRDLTKVVIAFVAGLGVAGTAAYVFVGHAHGPSVVQARAGSEQVPVPAGNWPTQPSARATSAESTPPSTEEPPAEVAPPKPQPTRKSRPEVRERRPVVSREAPAPVATAPEAKEAPAPTPAPEVAQNHAPGRPGYHPLQPESAPPAPPRQPKTVTLAAGTVVAVRLGETLSTDHNYSGDAFRATLDAPIVIDGSIIAERGSKVLGRIVESDKAGRVKGLSSLKLAVTEISTSDGQQIAVTTNTWDVQGQSSKKRDAAEIGGGAALGAIIGAIAGGGRGAAIGAGAGGAAGTGVVLGTRGKPATVPVETRLSFRLDSPVTITERLNDQAYRSSATPN